MAAVVHQRQLNERFVRLKLLVKAIRKGNITEAKELLNAGVNVNCTAGGVTPLHVAAAHDHVECAEFLLQNGAKVNQTIADFTTPLHVAARFDSLACVVLFINNGGDVNAVTKEGMSPLHLAARNGHLKTAEVLIAKGAEADFALKPPHPQSRSQGENLTPLHFSARHNHPECIKILAKYGGDLNKPTGKSLATPLHLAVQHKHLACSSALVSYGANVNVADLKGNTPLHLASAVDDKETTELLLQAGADVEYYNNVGKQPIDLGSAAIKSFLEPVTGQPRSLMFLCVLTIRKVLHSNQSRNSLEERVPYLPLPETIKDKLCLKDVLNIVS